jgi:glycine/D-amino acid oxidase-like deaminating enzyme
MNAEERTRNFDLIILGGGPAGTATALSLQQHIPSLSIVVVERSGYDRAWIGETLNPWAQLLLRQLGSEGSLQVGLYYDFLRSNLIERPGKLLYKRSLLFGHGEDSSERASVFQGAVTVSPFPKQLSGNELEVEGASFFLSHLTRWRRNLCS